MASSKHLVDLEVEGNITATGDVSIDGVVTSPEIVGTLTTEYASTGKKLIIAPENGYRSQGTGTSTGYLIIETPAVVGNSYSAFNIHLEIGGQYCSPLQMYISSQWLTTNFSTSRNYAYSTSDELYNYAVRWGTDGTKSYIIIGDSDTVWQRNSFAIKSVTTNYSNNDIEAFRENWDISIDSDISSITVSDTQADTDLISKSGVKRVTGQNFTGNAWNTVATLDFATLVESSGVIKVVRAGQGYLSFSFTANNYGKRTLKLEPGTAINANVYTGVRITDNDTIQVYVGSYSNAVNLITIEGYRLNGTSLGAESATGSETSLMEITDIDAATWGEVHAQELKINDKITAEDIHVSTGKIGIGTNNPAHLLHLKGADSRLRIEDSDGTNQFLEMRKNGAIASFRSRNDTSNGSYTFDGYDGTTVTKFMTIKDDGRVGIGTDNPAKLFTLNQKADSDGMRIYGHDDHSNAYGDIYLTSGGNLKITHTNPDSSGYIQIHSENYLQLAAGNFVYTDDVFRIYDAGRLDFGNSGDYKIDYDATSDILNIHTSGDAGMTVNSDGNVGIGTEDPQEKLEVYGHIKGRNYYGVNVTDNKIKGSMIVSGDEGVLKLTNGNNFGFMARGFGNTPFIGAYQGGSLTFRGFGTSSSLTHANDVDLMKIDFANEKVGIGTMSPDEKLDVVGSAKVSSNIYIGNSIEHIGDTNTKVSFGTDSVSLKAGGRNQLRVLKESAEDIVEFNVQTTNGAVRVMNDTATLMKVEASGNVGIGTTSPAEKLDVDGNIKADSFVKDGGLATEYLMADGTSKGQTAIFSVSSTAAMVALTTKQGDIVVRTDESKTYMDNGGDLFGSELLSNGDFSSIAFPWNYGTWSYIPTPTVSGGVATLTIDGGDYPAVNPRIEQSFATTSGEDYTIEVTGDGNGNDIQVLAVDPNNGYAFIDAFDITSNGTFTTGTMTVTATSANIVIQILVKGDDGDVAYLSNATAKEVDATAKYTHFASI